MPVEALSVPIEAKMPVDAPRVLQKPSEYIKDASLYLQKSASTRMKLLIVIGAIAVC